MKPKAVIFSGPDFFALDLVEALLAHNLAVWLFTSNLEWWQQAVAHLAHNQNLLVKSLNEPLPDDAAYVFANHRTGMTPESLRQEIAFIDASAAKACFLFSLFGERYENLPKETAAIYLGEIFGPRINEGSWTRQILAGFLPKEDFDIYPLYTKDAVKEILRQIFSYGFEKEEFALAEKQKASLFFNSVKNLQPEATYHYLEMAPLQPLPLHLLAPREKTDQALANTLDWLAKNSQPQPLEKPRVKKSQPPEPKIKASEVKKYKKPLLAGLVISFWLLMLPLVSLFLAALSLNFSYQSLLAGKTDLARVLLQTTQVVGGAGQSMAGFLSRLPLVKTVYASTAEALEVINLASQVGEKGLTVSDDAKKLFNLIFSQDEGGEDFTALSESLSLELGSLYQETSFLQSEIQSLPGFVRSFAGGLPDLEKNRGRISVAQALASDLPLILGNKSPATYLVLLQNNMELRPTGGFIGSFALVTFEKGKLIDLVVYDVYSADGQLKGHVEPPTQIKNYLGEANWFLRDSNWDPNFPTSAERAEWFLDKELDRGVDGVIGLDLEVFKSLLALTGPLKVADYETTVDADNLYERVQYEVEADFFPGSRKKANFLTALSNSLLDQLGNLQKKNYPGLVKAVFANLESRDIQVFLHQEKSARALSQLGWDGGLLAAACHQENCQTLAFGLNEANLGVNKVNRFISRESSLQTRQEGNFLVNNLTLKLKNSAPVSLGLGGRYKVYLRFLADGAATIDNVYVTAVGGNEAKAPELKRIQGRTEAGVLLEVPASQEKTVTFSWRQPLTLEANSPGFLQIHWRKQAGVPAQIAKVQVDLGTALYYNTDLSQDFIRTIPWLNQKN